MIGKRWAIRRALLVAAALTACTPVREPPSVVWFGNPAQVWALQTLQGEQVTERTGYIATIRMNPDHTVSGTAVCNSTSSAKLRWNVTDQGRQGTFNRLGSGAGITTTVGCNDPAAYATAGRFWTLMEAARSWSIHHDQLTIVFEDASEARLALLKRKDR